MRPMGLLIVLLGSSFAVVACGPSTTNGSATLAMGELCAPSRPDLCPGSMCRDVVSGESCDSYSCADWSQPAIEGTICTRACSNDSDCAGIDFAGTNELQASSEQWSCSGGTCHVLVHPPDHPPPTDDCTGCGGALCAGRCIGCPQC